MLACKKRFYEVQYSEESIPDIERAQLHLDRAAATNTYICGHLTIRSLQRPLSLLSILRPIDAASNSDDAKALQVAQGTFPQPGQRSIFGVESAHVSDLLPLDIRGIWKQFASAQSAAAGKSPIHANWQQCIHSRRSSPGSS